MTGRIGSFVDLISTFWVAWKQLLHALPLWDPYGAGLTLALAVALLGFGIKKVMD